MAFFPHDVAAPVPVPRSSVNWEEPSCPLCGRRHWRQLVEAPDRQTGESGRWFAVVQCDECGCCFTNPRPDPETIAQFYPPHYPPHQPPRKKKYRGHWPWQLPGQASRWIPWTTPGRLLDFGCGNGSFLERMHQHGWQVVGLDRLVSDELAAQAAGRYPILSGTLPHPDLVPASFDVITMWQSLEHVHDPLALLHEARRLLMPGGGLLVTVPNIAGVSFRWFGPAWFGLDLPRHLTHFTPVTLYRMLHRAGFQVGPPQMVRHPAWVQRSARLARSSWRRTLLRARLGARLADWYAYLTYQADCLRIVAQR